MSIVKRNIVANMLGKGASALFTLIFVPLHLKFLGVEAYGLVGVYATIQTMFLLMDLGFSGAFTREIARLSVVEDSRQEMRNLCRTFEFGYSYVGGIAALLIVTLSHSIALSWVHPVHLSSEAVTLAIALMGISIGLQFPFLIYQGGLQGLERQSALSGLNMAAGLLRGLGALLVLMFIEPSITAFFAWQIVVSVFQFICGRFLLRQSLPHTQTPDQISFCLVKPLWRFAAGMAGIAVCSMILMQADKVVLSRMISLEQFGYYSVASIVASIPFMLASPINNAVYPRLTQLVELRQFAELTVFYHRACQIISVLVIPTGLFLAFFSKEFLFLWTANLIIAKNAYQLVSVLSLGSMLLALMYIPYALQLAYSWTRLALYFNLISIILLVPALIWLSSIYGALGASFVWLALNLAYVFGMTHLMHKRILPGEKLAWYKKDVGYPFLSVLLIMALSSLFVEVEIPKLKLAALLMVIMIFSILSAAMSAPMIRNVLLMKWLQLQNAEHKF